MQCNISTYKSWKSESINLSKVHSFIDKEWRNLRKKFTTVHLTCGIQKRQWGISETIQYWKDDESWANDSRSRETEASCNFEHTKDVTKAAEKMYTVVQQTEGISRTWRTDNGSQEYNIEWRRRKKHSESGNQQDKNHWKKNTGEVQLSKSTVSR